MSKVLNLPERQDAEGTWHMVLKDVCGWCGCGFSSPRTTTTSSGSQVVITTSTAPMMHASATPARVSGGATTSGER